MTTKSLLHSSLLDNQYYNSMLVGNAGYVPPPVEAYDLLQSITLTSSQTSVSFSNLVSTYGSDYRNLHIRMSIRSIRSADASSVSMYFNGDTANNYSYHNLRGDGTSLISYANTSSAGASPGLLPAANFTTNRFGGMLIDIVDPFETTKFTTSRGHWFNIGTFKFVTTTSGNWRNTAAVDSIQLKDDNSQFAVNSTFDLYGLKDGA